MTLLCRWSLLLCCLALACGEGIPVADSMPAPAATTPDSILTEWLESHPNVANAITWQFQAANASNAYAAPAQIDKISWSQWTRAQQNDLNQAFLRATVWLLQGAPSVRMPYDGLTDEPVNYHPSTADDSIVVMENISVDYFWKLYTAHVAFALAQEMNHTLPWSFADYSSESLRYLFDSSVMAWRLAGSLWERTVDSYSMGTYGGAHLPGLRANTLPQTAFASPLWTYHFLQENGLIGATRQETIGKVMEWMRVNLVHFYGADTYGNYEAVWQYRGFPPLSKIVEGTVDANNPVWSKLHWTAGCHGSVGFLHAVLRTLAIPVQPLWVCGHELAYFPTEGLYLDHGDDPYNGNVRSAPSTPILSLLIDEPTYQSWFTPDLAVNINDDTNPACVNIARRAVEFR